jgi:hypothetical protein
VCCVCEKGNGISIQCCLAPETCMEQAHVCMQNTTRNITIRGVLKHAAIRMASITCWVRRGRETHTYTCVCAFSRSLRRVLAILVRASVKRMTRQKYHIKACVIFAAYIPRNCAVSRNGKVDRVCMDSTLARV